MNGSTWYEVFKAQGKELAFWGLTGEIYEQLKAAYEAKPTDLYQIRPVTLELDHVQIGILYFMMEYFMADAAGLVVKKKGFTCEKCNTEFVGIQSAAELLRTDKNWCIRCYTINKESK